MVDLFLCLFHHLFAEYHLPSLQWKVLEIREWLIIIPRIPSNIHALAFMVSHSGELRICVHVLLLHTRIMKHGAKYSATYLSSWKKISSTYWIITWLLESTMVLLLYRNFKSILCKDYILWEIILRSRASYGVSIMGNLKKIDRVITAPYFNCLDNSVIQYIARNMHTVFVLLCFVVVIHWLIVPYPSGLLHWHCGNLTIAPMPAKQLWWICINILYEFIMNDCITTTKQSTTKPCIYFLGYTVPWRSLDMCGYIICSLVYVTNVTDVS